MKLSFIAGLPDDIPTKLGPRVIRGEPKPEVFGDPVYNFMTQVAADLFKPESKAIEKPAIEIKCEAKPPRTHNVTVVVPKSAIKDEGVNRMGGGKSIDDIMNILHGRPTANSREDMRECVLAVKDRFGIARAKEIVRIHGQAEKLADVPESQYNEVIRVCIADLKGAEGF